jgi:hypothetical protein
MAETAVQLLKRDEQLKSQQDRWLSSWQDIATFTAPERQRILVKTEGPITAQDLFDSSAIHASKLLAASIHGTMTPSTQPWISFVMRDDELNDTEDVREWLEDCAKRIHKALRQSNFNTAAHEKYLDLVVFGTACMLIEEKAAPKDGGFGGFRFTTVPIGTYRAAEDRDGLVDTLFRDLKLSRRVCVDMWKGQCGEAFVTKALLRPDEIVDVLHAVYPRRDRAYDAKGDPKGGAANYAWASCYVIRENKAKAAEGGFEEFPYVVPRWLKLAGEVYGSGPSHTAIYDVKTLNDFVRLMLQAIPLAVQPPSFERDDAVIGPLDRNPGGRNVINASGPIADAFMFVDTHYKPEVAEQFRISMKAEIERLYHANELQLRESPQMTATEAQIRYELMQRVIGPTTGRIESEDLNPATWRMFSIMARRNAFKPLPASLQDAVGQGSDAADLDVQYEGPLARAQRTIELTAQDRVVAFVTQTAAAVAPFAPQLAQEIVDILKLDKMARDRGQITGLASDSLKSETELEELRADRKVAADKQAKQDEMSKAAEAMGKAAPMLAAVGKPPGGAPKAA